MAQVCSHRNTIKFLISDSSCCRQMEVTEKTQVLFNQSGLGWRLLSEGSTKLLFAGTVLGVDGHGLLELLRSAHPNLAAIVDMVQQFNGHFGIVYQDESKIVAVTDCVSSYPIFYRSFDRVCKIATSANALGSDCTIDKSQARAVMLSGYTVGRGTVFREISSLGHGKVFFQNGVKKIMSYQAITSIVHGVSHINWIEFISSRSWLMSPCRVLGALWSKLQIGRLPFLLVLVVIRDWWSVRSSTWVLKRYLLFLRSSGKF